MLLSGAIKIRALAKWSFLLLALSVCSCSGGSLGLNPVHGKVLYKGSPTGGIMVALHPSGGDDPKRQVPTGLSDDEGNFTIMTGQDEGAPAGDYFATVVWIVPSTSNKKEAKTMSMNADINVVDKLKNKYGDVKNPVFKGITIKKGVNELEPFNLQ